MTEGVRGTFHFLQQENLRLQEENERLQDQIVQLRLILRTLSKLSQLTHTITREMEIMQLIDQVLSMALVSVGADDGSLLLIDEATRELVFVKVKGEVSKELTQHRIPLGVGIAGWVAEHGQPEIIPNVYMDQRFSPDVDRKFQFKTHSMLCVPVMDAHKTLGVLQVLNKSNRRDFTATDLAVLGIVAQLAGMALAKAEKILAE